MAFDWNEYHSIALTFAKSDEEASMRCAISRAYYCAFNLALSYARNRDSSLPKKIGHQELWQKFLEYGRADGDAMYDIETHGDRARKLRVKADYDDEIPRLRDDLTAAMTHVRKVLANIPKSA